MSVTKELRKTVKENYIELQLRFWKRQQEQTRDMDYWHYIQNQIQSLEEHLDIMRRNLEGVSK